MSVELTVPEVGESITEVQIGRWLKDDGASVKRDEDLVEIETEKASVVVPAPADGVLKILTPEGEFAEVGDAIARISEGDGAGDDAPAEKVEMQARDNEGDEPAPQSSGRDDSDRDAADSDATDSNDDGVGVEQGPVMPAAARMIEEHDLDPDAIKGTGPGGRILKEDVQRHLKANEAKQAARATLDEGDAEGSGQDEATAADREKPATETPAPATPDTSGVSVDEDGRAEEVRPMSMIRRTIANRLVEAQQNAALLTTFNEVDMAPVKELRARYKEDFEKRHDVRLGFMSFFVKAAVEALQQFPAVNAEVRDRDIVYRNYCDIGIAIGSGKGLVVPVLRNAEKLSFAGIEKKIADLGERAQENRIEPDELTGGTFTISNGGVYGSLMSTPIVNPPQSGILGMHAIQDRPVVRDGEIVVRPMMYVALTYDHRIIDGREAVTFLRTIKDVIEDPARLLLEV